MKIGEFARRGEVNIDTVRFYEKIGLLPEPRRRVSGYREYSQSDLQRLHSIVSAKQFGFTLEQIQELLALTNDEDGNMAALKAVAVRKLADVESKLAELERVRDALKALVAACPGQGAMSTCPLAGALFGIANTY